MLANPDRHWLARVQRFMTMPLRLREPSKQEGLLRWVDLGTATIVIAAVDAQVSLSY